MAEARRAVEPYPSVNLSSGIDPSQPKGQIKVTHQGISIFVPNPKLILKALLRASYNGYKKVQHAFMPFPVPFALGTIMAAVAYMGTSKSNLAHNVRNSWYANWIWALDSKMPFVKYFTTNQRVAYLTFNTSVGIMTGFTAFHRLLLRTLLCYTGWMTEGRGKMSLKTKLWGLLLSKIYIQGSKVDMRAYQGCLPGQPVPKVSETIRLYLESMEPILSTEEFAQLKADSDKFQKEEGKTLQRYLQYKYCTSTNYVSDWWLDVVYLRDRNSLMINSNYYGLSMPDRLMSTSQVDRAAFIINAMARAANGINRGTHRPMLIQNMVPVCMDQYKYCFATNRTPGAEMDKLVKYDEYESRHVAVYHKGKLYKLKLYSESSGRLLTPNELRVTIQGILDDKEVADAYEAQIPVLTTWNRTKWSECRNKELQTNKVNRKSLDIVESALFYVVLSDEAQDTYTAKGKHYIHNNGRALWMDKSVSFTFTTDGDWGLTGEHSWGDAPAAGHMVEWCLATEVAEKPYDENGILKESKAFQTKIQQGRERLYHAQRLPWMISEGLRANLDEAAAEADKAIADFDLCSQPFRKFGKNVITKQMKCSPDGFIQMAIQLAYFRDQGKFVQTYESAMARLWSEGRTETIRSQTKKSCAFVHAMENPEETNENRWKLLRAACDQHSSNTQQAMIGNGVDRHLFALYVVAIGTKTESPFLLSCLKRGWKLSTSQVPGLQAPYKWPTDKDTHDDYPRPSGGFGPVADDGYGCCYTIIGNKSFHFHVSAKKSAENTDAERFQGRLQQALQDLVALAETDAEKK